MAKFKKRTMSIKDEIEFRTLKARADEQEALLDYIAAMTDVDIPEEAEDDE